ncbi:hypothetical protein C8F04DRAFT_966602 [Mycena alexandri]|uniref:Uncharacterized protein n=1 Tax=Mycena alexandri TaxID=1745969 RepID=A0AAD6SEM4_9AGAR|nr:hypothetical protein C8F04DRAFT_966602 [Mycena alexandri]
MAARNLSFTASSLPAASVSNPISLPRTHEATPAPATKTIPQRTVYHTLQADLAPMMAQIQTQEQLDSLRESLAQVQRTAAIQARQEQVQDPPTITRKGRPPTQRLTGPTEGPARGGGARIPMQGPRVQRTLPSRELALPHEPATQANAGSSQRRQNQCSLCREFGHNRTSCSLRAQA